MALKHIYCLLQAWFWHPNSLDLQSMFKSKQKEAISILKFGIA